MLFKTYLIITYLFKLLVHHRMKEQQRQRNKNNKKYTDYHGYN